MGWYVLKNRRHVGPYSEEDIRRLWEKGTLRALDFVIHKADAERGELIYRRVSEAFAGLTELSAVGHGSAPEARAPEQELELREFSDEDLEKSQVSRIFTEAFDSVDAVGSAGAHVNPNVQRIGEPSGSRVLSAPLAGSSAAPADPSKSLFWTFAPWAAAVLVLVVGAGAFYQWMLSPSKVKQPLQEVTKSVAPAANQARASKAQPSSGAKRTVSVPAVTRRAPAVAAPSVPVSEPEPEPVVPPTEISSSDRNERRLRRSPRVMLPPGSRDPADRSSPDLRNREIIEAEALAEDGAGGEGYQDPSATAENEDDPESEAQRQPAGDADLIENGGE